MTQNLITRLSKLDAPDRRIDPLRRQELIQIAHQVADEAGKVFRDTLSALLRAKEASNA